MSLQFCGAAWVLLTVMACQVLPGEQPPSQPPPDARITGSPPNLGARTLGGVQLWSDQLVFHEWRIQQHAFTHHFRLLDDRQARRARGTFQQCHAALAKYKQELNLPPLAGKVVVLLHGLARSRGSLDGLAAYFRAHSDYLVLNVSYASTRHEIGRHAESLASVIHHLPEVDEVNFVAHSMGNLVVRHYLADRKDLANSVPCDRIGRVVMLAPPNQGSILAQKFRDVSAFQLLSGSGGRQIANWESLTGNLTTPSCEFGIIAGGTGQKRGYNPLIKGDNDLVVAVAETKLAGARDFAVVPCWHTTLMDNPLVREYTLRFLQHGYFRSPAERTPITETPDAPSG